MRLLCAILLVSGCAAGASDEVALEGAALECQSDADCALPASRSACTDVRVHCDAGACVTETFDHARPPDPGSCETARDCACQPLLPGTCQGAFDCEAGRCLWRCDDVSSCHSDTDCPLGQTCEPGAGCGSDFRCVKGCRGDQDCRKGDRCAQYACATCPCPARCEWDPCADVDGDGYVRTCDTKQCPGAAGRCDCNDEDPEVHPGATERCGNRIDDDCDGYNDEACPACGARGGPALCAAASDCALGQTYCTAGCCYTCPKVVRPSCAAGECVHERGSNGSGCPQSAVCGKCCDCKDEDAPVCGSDFVTYENACEAKCLGVAVVHDGACVLGEGTPCGAGCGPGLYCHPWCPTCSPQYGVCVKAGTCIWPSDCPAGRPNPCEKPRAVSCESGQCIYDCLQ